ncbi:hypothetical protein DXG01_009109 [Tephrocybe rancida]|nr:hypothetical protein DXG01_009109 [Tephrocybe rancida]
MNTKLSVTTVCKSWHAVGIRFLYEDIAFRTLAQIPVFLRTIKMDPSKFGTLVRNITIHAFVGPQYDDSFTRYIQEIVDSCPSLRQIGSMSPHALPLTTSLPTLPSNITRVSFNDLTPAILSLLGSTQNSLLSLALILPAVDSPEWLGPDIQTPFSLPNLEDLAIAATPLPYRPLTSLL